MAFFSLINFELGKLYHFAQILNANLSINFDPAIWHDSLPEILAFGKVFNAEKPSFLEL